MLVGKRIDHFIDTYSSFVKPKDNIPYYITRINGILNQMISGIDYALAIT
jgi:DNA polymerase III alpha subunit (gram-positive type)